MIAETSPSRKEAPEEPVIAWQRRLLSATEWRRIVESGALPEDDRIELIGGELVSMTPISARHASAVARLSHLLFCATAGDAAVLFVQNPLALNDSSEVQPDVMLLKPRSDFYSTALPVSSDVFLLVEVSASTSRFDRGVKVPLYAREGIREVWIVNLDSQRVETWKDPSGEGYRTLRSATPDETIAPSAFPNLSIRVADILA